MRYVTKREEDKTERLACDDTYQALLAIANSKNTSLISDNIYRDSYETAEGKRSRVEDKLAISYKYKCAYCERICKADIEHYRPKKGVDEDKSHPGYYWLCYEWTNLIPSCITCNREGAKHNKFPVLGPRVFHPVFLEDGNLDLTVCKASISPLLDENPYLLHPEVDKPEDFFMFDVDPTGEGIRIIGVDINGRGNSTIQICRLNRLEIKLDRVERVIDDFKDAVNCLVAQLESGVISEHELVDKISHNILLLHRRSKKDDNTHTYLRKYITSSVKNFEEIMIPFLNYKVRKIVLEAFKLSIQPK